MNETGNNKKKKETDSDALDYRIYVHKNFSKNDFDKWVINSLNLEKGLKALDVGCGSGKFLIKIAEIVGENGLVCGLDISELSLDKCNKTAEGKNLRNIRLVNADLTQIKETVSAEAGKEFNRALSSFAIYYTTNKGKTFRDIFDLLKTEGMLFVCGPTKKNNTEFLNLVKKAGGKFSEDFIRWSEFLDNEAVKCLKEIFGHVEILYFENPIEFPSADTVFKYWKATALYDETIEESMMKEINEHFKDDKTFTTNKVVIGLKCIKK